MVARNPIVLVGGTLAELPAGDTVNGAAAAGVASSAEIDLGSVPRRSGYFGLPTVGATVGGPVQVVQLPGPYTGKGTRGDEAEFGGAVAVAAAITSPTLVSCYWTASNRMRGNVKFQMTSATGISASQVTITMTQLTANRVYQRDTLTGGGLGKGVGSVDLAISLSAASPVYARCRDAVGGVTIVQAPFLASASTTTGTRTLTGIEARLGQFFLDVATSASGPWTNGTSAISMGDLIALSGQSLGVRLAHNIQDTGTTLTTLGITPNGYGFGYVTSDSRTTPAWLLPSAAGNLDSAFAAEFLNYTTVDRGVNCALIGHAVGQTSIGQWWAGSPNWTTLLARMAEVGGKWRDTLWYQGHSDSVYGVTATWYKAFLTQIFGQFDAANAFAGTKRKYLGAFPIYTSPSGQWGTPAMANAVRKAGVEWATANSAGYLHAADGAIAAADGVHQTQAGSQRMARHAYRLMKAAGDAGPVIASAARTAATTLRVTYTNGGAALAGTGSHWTRLLLCDQGNVRNKWPLSGATIVNATTVDYTIANDPGGGNVLNLYAGFPDDPGNDMTGTFLADTLTDGDGLGTGRVFVPNVDPVPVAAIGSGVNVPPGGNIAKVSRFDLTGYNTPTFGGAALQAGFGASMDGGTAAQATYIFAVTAPMTVEAMFQMPASGGGRWWLAGSNQCALQIDGGRIRIDYLDPAGTVRTMYGTTALTAGNVYWAAMVLTGARVSIYLYDITSSGGTRGRDATDTVNVALTQPTTATFKVRGYNTSDTFLMFTGPLSHVAVSDAELYTGTAFVLPTTPYATNKANLVALWRLNGDVLDAVRAH